MNTIYRARIRFQKSGVLRFIGHLDLMRYFQKAIRRANLPVRYSEGFSPHQVISFALPLGVGLTSSGEYLDIDLLEQLPESELLERLNACTRSELAADRAVYIPIISGKKSRKAMAEVSAASYLLYFRDGNISSDTLLQNKAALFDPATEWLIEKKTKKSTRQLDLLPLVYSFDLSGLSGADSAFLQEQLPDWKENGFRIQTGDPAIRLLLSAGSENNIKPELFMDSFLQRCGYEETDYRLGIHRMELYWGDPGSTQGLQPLGQVSADAGQE